jgi:hypothetical protein
VRTGGVEHGLDVRVLLGPDDYRMGGIDVDVHEVRAALLRAAARPPGRCRWSRSSRSGWWPAAVGGRPRPGQGERGASEGTAHARLGDVICWRAAHFARFPRRGLSFMVESGWRRTVDCLTNLPVLALRPRCPPDDPPCGFFPAMRISPLARAVARAYLHRCNSLLRTALRRESLVYLWALGGRCCAPSSGPTGARGPSSRLMKGSMPTARMSLSPSTLSPAAFIIHRPTAQPERTAPTRGEDPVFELRRTRPVGCCWVGPMCNRYCTSR